MFDGCKALETLEGLGNIGEDYWVNAVEPKGATNPDGEKNGGVIERMFYGVSVLSLDLRYLSTMYGSCGMYMCVSGLLGDAATTKVTYGKRLYNQQNKNGSVMTNMNSAVYWTPQGKPDERLTSLQEFWDYHMEHGYGKGDVTYVRWIQPTFNANGGTWDPAVNQNRVSEGEKLNGQWYTGVAFQMYNGEDDDVDGKVKEDPSGYVSWGSRHLLGWFDSKQDADNATSAAAKGAEAETQPGYIDLSKPATFQYLEPNKWNSTTPTVYAAWSKAQDVPVTDADGTTLPTTFIPTAGKASGSAKAVKMNPDLFTVADDPGYLTVTDGTTGNAITGVKVTGQENDWKIQIPNNAQGYAPLRATVSSYKDNESDGMFDKATITVTYPVMATVVDASGQPVTPADNSGDMDPNNDGLQVLVDPQALAKGKDGKGSYKLEKGEKGYAITVPNQSDGKVPSSVAIQKVIDKTPADGNQEYVPGKIPENTPFEEVWLDVSYLGRATLTVDVSDKDYTGEPVSFAAQSTPDSYVGTQDFTYYVKDDSVQEDQGAGTGWKRLDSAPTNAGTYKVVLTSTPANPDEWASPEIRYNGPTDANKRGEFTIKQAQAPAFTLSKVDSYTYNGTTPEDPTFTQTNGPVAGISGATATYTWQQKQGESYVDIPGNAKPTLPGDYRVVANITPGEGEQTPTITGDGWTPGENNTYTCDFSINKVTVHFTGKAQTKEWDNNPAAFDVEALEGNGDLSATLNFGEGGWKGGDPTPTVSLNKEVEWYASNGTDKLEGAPTAVGTYKVKVSWTEGVGWDAGSGFVDYEITKSAAESGTFTIHYDSNAPAGSVSGMPEDQTVKIGLTGQTLSSQTPSMPGYSFKGWMADGSDKLYQPGASIEGALVQEAGQTLTLYAQWERNDADVTYKFVSGTKGHELPEQVTSLEIPDSVSLPEGSVIAAPTTTYEPIADGLGGTWTFKGWSPNTEQTLGKDGVTFTGTWEWTENTRYPIHYDFAISEGESESGAPKELPESVLSLLDGIEPSDAPEGAPVAAPTTTFEPVKDGEGTWSFIEWSPDASAVMTKNGLDFTGYWKWSKNPAHDVTYNFVSGTDGKDLPESVTKLCPDKTSAHEGAQVTPPTLGTIVVSDGMGGKWTFTGWAPESQTMEQAPISFTGTWVWSENNPATIDFKFGIDPTSDEGAPSELPQGVTDQLPQATQAPIDSSYVPSSGFTSVKDGTGTWYFQGWNPLSGKVTEEGLHLKGLWKWVKDEPESVEGPHGVVGEDGNKVSTTGDELPDKVEPGCTVNGPEGTHVDENGNIVVPNDNNGNPPTSVDVTIDDKDHDGVVDTITVTPTYPKPGSGSEPGSNPQPGPNSGDNNNPPVEGEIVLPGSDNTPNTDDDVTVVIPGGSHENEDGTITIPSGEETVLPGPDNTPGTNDDIVVIPNGDGGILHPNGDITLPDGGKVIYPGGGVYDVPNGSVVHPDGSITLPDGTTLSFDNAKASATMPKTGDYTQGIIYGLIGTALLSLIVMVVVRKTSKRKV